MRVLTMITAAIMAVVSPISCESMKKADAETGKYTIQDVRELQDFLLGKPAGSGLKDKAYDLDGDGKWTAYDLCLMKQTLADAPDTDVLVAYFSRTGNTEKIAEHIISITGADSYVINAAVPYTDADIRYQDDNCRANKEQNDKMVRPEIAEPLESLEKYDVIYLGYPIWWGEEPRIIDTFLESGDFSDKVVIPFCTSGSSGIARSEKNIAELVPIGAQPAGRRFAASASESDVQKWIDGITIPEIKKESVMKISVNRTELRASFADTKAAQELKEKLSSGPVTLELGEYGGFEKVGKLPWTLSRTDEKVSTEAGDIMLYQGNQMTIFYNTNSWSYTRIGVIDEADRAKLPELFGSGDVTVTLSLD